MRIGVLGPLRVEVAGRPVELGGPRPRRVLAALIAHAGEVVSVDALVMAAWGQEPPPSAVRTLQAYITRLRATLRDNRPADRQEPGVIVTAPNGYRLAVPPDAVDAAVFVDRIRRARRALDDEGPETAEGLLAEALGLWRGPPYGEFADTDFGIAEALRLEEVRLSGLETQLDAALLAGRAAEVVADAERLCVEHPLRERFWAQLMVGLYRSGRQADALAAFQRLRTLLAEEIGADPGPALRTLEQQVLRQDPALAAPEARPAARGRHVADAAPPAARPASVATWAERRVATVMAAHVDPDPGDRGWSDPERADAALSRLREVLGGAVADVGGVVAGLTGMQAVVVFGVERAHDDHADRALHAALVLRERYGSTLRAGVATGELLSRGGPADLSVAGEPVRVAVSLQQRAGRGQILVAQRTVAAVRGRFTVTALTDHPLPGAPPLSWAELVSAAPRPRAAPGAGGVFVGRHEELDVLAGMYRRTVELRRPHLVTVLGDAGIGKSALVGQFLERLGAGHLDACVPEPVRYAGRCLAYGRGNSYDAFGEILRAHIGL